MTEDTDNCPQPLGEAETIARGAGTVAAADTDVEAVEIPDDQPRGEIETAAAAKASTTPRAGFEASTTEGLLPGEAVGSPRPPAGAYQFLPGDGQAAQREPEQEQPEQEQSESESEPESEQPESEPALAAESEPEPKSRKAKKAKNEESD